MSEYPMGDPGPVCDESGSWDAEMALGLLSGPERAAGLSHLASCPGCRQQVHDLAGMADRLLLLAPDVEPPAGFESRVLAAVGSAAAGAAGDARAGDARTGLAAGVDPAGPATDRGRAGRRRRRSWPGAGLAASLAATAAVGGWILADALRSPPASPVLRTGLAVSASGRTSCRVVVSGTRPASVLVSMDGYPGSESEFGVEMVTVTGAVVPLGAMPVTGGHGLLVRSVEADAGDLHLMRMVDGEGRVVYEATLADAVPSTPPFP